jgi:hypothetical protein
MLSKKYYLATAEILSSYKNLIGNEFIFHDLVEDFSAMYAKDNLLFDANKFVTACNK